MPNHSLEHRIEMIQDDMQAIRKFIDDNGLTEIFNKKTAQCDTAITHLNNIEIACDLSSDESTSWKLFTNTKL